MIKNVLFKIFLLLSLGCDGKQTLTAEEVIQKCQKCQEQGMEVKVYSNIVGNPKSVECIPTEKQKYP